MRALPCVRTLLFIGAELNDTGSGKHGLSTQNSYNAVQCTKCQQTHNFLGMTWPAVTLFPHSVGVFCTLLETPKCHIQTSDVCSISDLFDILVIPSAVGGPGLRSCTVR